jgi:hypothetical protein
MQLIENYLIISLLIVLFWAISAKKKKKVLTIIVMAIFSSIITPFLIGIYAGEVFAQRQ